MRLDTLKARLPELIKEHGVPGLQLGVVYKGDIILCDACGYRDLENKIKADMNTVFAIGSVSKSFIAASLALLVDEGRLEWDDRVKKYIPDFEMYDDYVTHNLTVRDICSHRCGLPRHDMSWYCQEGTLAELVSKIKYLKPNKSFREEMQYQNHMYALASRLIEAVTGIRWGEFVKDKLLKPLSMNNTCFSVSELEGVENKALPYRAAGVVEKLIEFKNIDNVAGAGSINSTVQDMTAWIRLQLGKGMFDGLRIITEDNMQKCYSPQMLVRNFFPWKAEEMDAQAYGFGWFTEIYRGHRVVYHGGNVDGFTSAAAFIPEIDSGFTILTNKDSSLLTVVLQYMLFDRLLGLEPLDWNERIKASYAVIRQKYIDQRVKLEGAVVKDTRPTYEASKYEGTYSNLGYGKVSIAAKGRRLQLLYGTIIAELQHLCFDSFYVDIEAEMLFAPMQFVLTPTGCISGVRIRLEPDLDEYLLFEKV